MISQDESGTDQGQAEPEFRYRDLIAYIPGAVWAAQTNGKILYANAQIEPVTGFTAEEFIKGGAEFWTRHVHPADVQRLFSIWDEVLATGGGTLETEYRFLRKNSEWVWLQQRISMVSLDNREGYIVGITVDVTARRNAEEALRASERRYRTLVEQARDIIFALDLEGRFESLNAAFETVTGWPRDEWLGRTFVELMDERSIPLALERFRDALAGEDPLFGEYLLRTKSGGLVTIEATAAGVGVGGQIVGTIGIARDITQRKEAEAEQEKEKRLASLGQLATSVAHEFNNVLMSIMPFAELLQRRFPGDERVRSSTDHIIQAVRRGRQISQEVLRFARPVKPALEPISVSEWLQRFAARAEELLGPKYQVHRVLQPADRNLVISADRALLDQVCMNLLINARDAMPDGGMVTFEGKRGREEGMVEIVVRDNGPGIAESVMDHIFEPLFTTKRGGSGLGLSVAYQAVKQQEGTLIARSTPGAGSAFTISLRASDAVPTALVAEPSHRRRILLVEDDEAVGEGLTVLLSDEGFEVKLVALGREARKAIEEFKPHLVLLDVNLPDISGIDVYEEIQTFEPALPVIFSTGHADASALEDVRRRGVPSIMKPYDLEELLAIIARIK